MKGFTTFIVLVAIVIVGFLIFRKPTTAPTTTDNANDISLSDINTADASINGSKDFDTAQSRATWTGSKTLIKEYFDTGTVNIKSGNATFANGVITGGEVVFDMSTIATTSTGRGNEADTLSGQAKHMKSADFFDVENYPEAKFVITSISHEAGDTYMLTGNLTIKGSTHATTFPVEVVTTDGVVTIQGTATIDRTLWDIKYGSDKFFTNLGDNVIGDEFTLNFLVVTK